MRHTGALNRTWSKVQAAAMIEALLDEQVAYGVIDGNPKLIAHAMVARAWALHPAHFDGSQGEHPHQIVVAATALAIGIRIEAQTRNIARQCAYTLALGQMLDEIARNAPAYGLRPLDHQLLDAAAAIFTDHAGAPMHAAPPLPAGE